MHTAGSRSNTPIVIALLALIAICGFKLKHDWDVRERTVAASRQIEHHFTVLFGSLDLKKPSDPTPRLLFTREQFLRKQSAASEKQKRAVYESAIKLTDALINVAAERRQILEVLLKKAAQPRAKLDMAHSVTSSAQYFLQLDLQRSNEALSRKKPALEQLLSQLRKVESEWNARLPKGASEEGYDSKSIPHAPVTIGSPSNPNPLQRRPYDQRGAIPIQY